MKLNRHSGMALLLIFFGSLILLTKIGHHPGQIMGWVLPIAMLGLGWLGVNNGRKKIGLVLMGIGGLILLVKMSGLFAVLIAIGLILYGISMLRNRSAV
jgi:lia operon protein LiaI